MIGPILKSISYPVDRAGLFPTLVLSVFPLWILLILVLAFGAGASAQTTTGSIYGTITDASGAAVAGVKITLTNVDTNGILTVKTNGSGAYVFPAVDAGMYKVTTTANGFQSVTLDDIRLAANQNVNASTSLRVGAEASVVEVEASSTLVDTRESALGETIDRQRIVDLPLVGRSAYDLVQLVPGITDYSGVSQTGGNQGLQFRTNGLRNNVNSFYLDGAYNTEFYSGGGNLIPNPDALEQFRILTSNFDAEFGRYPGAVVNVLTRSGTNTFHGSVYEFFRNDLFNASNYFSTIGVTPMTYNVFGAGIGGPIVRDKAFIFLNYQGIRISTPEVVQQGSLTFPTAAERTGDFRLSAKKPSASYCGATYILCPADLDPVAMTIIAHFVPPAVNAAGDNPVQQAPSPLFTDQGVVRLDYQLSRSHKLKATYFNSQGFRFQRRDGDNDLLTYGGITVTAEQYNYILGDTWIISSSAVSSLVGFYSNNNSAEQEIFPYTWATLGGVNPDAVPSRATQPEFSVTGYFGGGSGGPGRNTIDQLTYGLSETVDYSRGNHGFKIGGSFLMNRYQETSIFKGSGVATFSGGTTGNALADFMEGKAKSFDQNNGSYHRTHAPDPSIFAQDDWRIARRLTLNIGARYEVYYPLVGQNNVGTFQAGVQSTRFPTAPLGLLSSGDPGVPDGILHTSYLKVAPRVGFAFDVFGDGRTSLRGAYGIFYSNSQETLSGNLEQEPFTLSLTLNQTNSWANAYSGIAPYNGVSPFPYVVNVKNPTFLPGAALAGMRPNEHAIPYAQEYNLTVEQQYGNNWGTRLSYVGNTSRHSYVLTDQNAPVFVPGAAKTTAGINARRPLQGYAAIGLINPIDNSSYNALQFTVTRRFRKGFTLLANYTWSKDMDEQSSDNSSFTAYNASDQYDIGRDRGLSDIDTPHRFIASVLYHLPQPKSQGFIGKYVLSGWQVNGIEVLSSGNPFNLQSNFDSNLDGLSNDRPDLAGNPYLPSNRSRAQKIAQYFNTAAFVKPDPSEEFGNVQRNFLIGPGTKRTELSLFKRFKIHESTLMFRGEAFNLFNNVNLNNPNATITAANYGRITGAADPRIMQLALKYEF